MNLFQKIVEVRKSIDGFNKDKKSFGYDYVSGNQVLGKIKEKMDELGLILSPSCTTSNHEKFVYTNDKGKEKIEFIVWGEMIYTWFESEKLNEQLQQKWQYYGQQDDISKAFGSALTYAERYYLLKFFGIPTDADDPDSRKTGDKKPPTPPPEEPQYLCEECQKPFKKGRYGDKIFSEKQMYDDAKKKYGKAICQTCKLKKEDGIGEKLNKGFEQAFGNENKA